MRQKKSNTGKYFLLLTLLSIIIYIALFYLYTIYSNLEIPSNYKTNKLNSTVSNQNVENIYKNTQNISEIIEKVSNSTVGISKLTEHTSSIFSITSEDELGLGTGVIVSNNGYILSNYHVTGEKYSSCYVTLDNTSTYTATVIWADSDLDLSICKIDAQNLSPIILGDSSSVKAGQTVYAIGNPIGFEFKKTVTSGIISATNRTIRLDENSSSSYMTNLIQTDATINPGNSGGPLILSDGTVIGINTVKITSAEGIGFAVPVNVVKPIIESFINTGTFEEASIGIYAYDKEVLPYLNSDISFENGIYVVEVNALSSAAKTGLQQGDIINSINGINLSTMNELKAFVYTKKPGDYVTLNVSRGKVEKEISFQLRKKVAQKNDTNIIYSCHFVFLSSQICTTLFLYIFNNFIESLHNFFIG